MRIQTSAADGDRRSGCNNPPKIEKISQQSDRELERKGGKQGAHTLVEVVVPIVKHGNSNKSANPSNLSDLLWSNPFAPLAVQMLSSRLGQDR